jgi:very-short-patch-repair endonuclease
MHGQGAPGHKPIAIQSVCGAVQVSERGDRGVAELAAAQRGVVSRGQLAAIGLGRGAIGHRVATGRLHRLHPRVYLVGHAIPPRLAPELAALLWCGGNAVLSHRTAAMLWGLIDGPVRGVDVSVKGRDCGRRAGIRVHRVRHLSRDSVAIREQLPVTTPTRTLLDFAEAVGPSDLERAVAEALTRRLTDEDALRQTAERAVGRRGGRALRDLLNEAGGPALTRSEAERRLLTLIRRSGLSTPETNVKLGRYEVDFLWRPQRLVVEVDGYAFHSSRSAFERDRAKDAHLQAAGYRTLRLTWRQLTEAPEVALANLATALASR